MLTFAPILKEKYFTGAIDMKSFERILIKIAIIQFVFLIIAQLFFHEFNAFPELKQITQYEGVTDNNHSEVLKSIMSKK
jgi:hypothetical protein